MLRGSCAASSPASQQELPIRQQHHARQSGGEEESAAVIRARDALEEIEREVLLLADIGDGFSEVFGDRRLIRAVRCREAQEEAMERDFSYGLVGWVCGIELWSIVRAQVEPVERDAIAQQAGADAALRR